MAVVFRCRRFFLELNRAIRIESSTILNTQDIQVGFRQFNLQLLLSIRNDFPSKFRLDVWQVGGHLPKQLGIVSEWMRHGGSFSPSNLGLVDGS